MSHRVLVMAHRPLVSVKQSFLRTGNMRQAVSKSKNSVKQRSKDRFPEKLWRIVNECRTGAIGWSCSQADVIFIKYTDFRNQYLMSDVPAFKTRNIASFVRQLNLYGFHKINPVTARKGNAIAAEQIHYFGNACFRKDRQPIGMVRSYGSADCESAAGVRRGSQSVGQRVRKQMGTPVEHFLPDLLSELHERDIATHSVRFHSPQSPVRRKSQPEKPECVTKNKRVTKKQQPADAQENRIPLSVRSKSNPKSKINQKQACLRSKLRDISNQNQKEWSAEPEVELLGTVVRQKVQTPLTDWYEDMLHQMDRFHMKSFDAMAKSLGGEDPVPWYPNCWDRSLTMTEVMDQRTAPSAFLSPLTAGAFDLIRDDSLLF